MAPAPVPARASATDLRAIALSALACASAAACAPPAPPAPPVVHVDAAGAPPPTAPPSAPAAPPLKEGIVLAPAAGAELHAVEGALFVSTKGQEDKGEGRLLYLARGDKLVPQPAHALPQDVAGEGLEILGRFPDHVFAVAHGRNDADFTTRVLRRKDDGWADLPVSERLFDAVWWSDRLMGLVRDPATPLGRKLVRLDAPGPELAIPKAEGPACDAFYAKWGSGIPRLALQPQGLSSAAQQLFLLGYGCDNKMAAAAWGKDSPAASLIAMDEPAFMDGFPGAIVGRHSRDLWYFRRPMRPAALAALWHSDGARWSRVPWPSEDPQVEGVAVDERGTLWAAIDGKLYRRAAERWVERSLPRGCEARLVAASEASEAGGASSLWVACLDAVARLSPTAAPW